MEDSPAYLILSILSDINLKGRRGRPSLNLLDMIRNDLKRKIILNSLRLISDFEDLQGPLLLTELNGSHYVAFILMIFFKTLF